MVVATNNGNKLKEIKEILKIDNILSLKEKNINIEISETGNTFYDNALLKAKTIYDIVKEPVIADDSGLCIEGLNNWPGVLTNRFLDNSSDQEKNDYILTKMNNMTNRKAQFICVIVYYDGINIIVGEGILEGKIAENKRGNNGFGFDEIFELSNGKTLAELTDIEKNKISARKIALEKLKNKIENK